MVAQILWNVEKARRRKVELHVETGQRGDHHMGSGAHAGELMVDKCLCLRGAEGDGDQDAGRTTQVTVCRQVEDSGSPLESGGDDAGQLGRENAKCH